MSDWYAANRRGWDERVAIHLRDRTGFYGVDGLKRGERTLGPIVDAELGPVAGLSVVHLQCHFGLDTLTMARNGARVVGLDFSPAAIAAARALAAETGLAARFVEGDVYDAPKLIDERFDRVFVTWGAICWLPRIDRWAAVVAAMLKPGADGSTWPRATRTSCRWSRRMAGWSCATPGARRQASRSTMSRR
jgi:2-polyprenyl-3-methyl-5-hydroxy-6-metoxy-1,4-benzoquinol methylase